MTRWIYPHELERNRTKPAFDPAAEGQRHRLTPDLSTALWARVCAASVDANGRPDLEEARRLFHEIAARLSSRGGGLRPDVGRVTRVGTELEGPSPEFLGVDLPAVRTPGRETLTRLEAQRWARTTAPEPPVVDAERAAPAAHAERNLESPGGSPVQSRMSRLFDVVPQRGAIPPALPTARAEWPAAVMRSAERAEVDPEAAELVARARRSGSPLDAELRSQLESTLGADLDGVRIHLGAEADAAARALGARAFTVGDDVYFRDGAYAPQQPDGQRLIAHEVAHTVQARGAAAPAPGAMTVSQPDDAPEREADAFADAFVRGLHGTAARSGKPGVDPAPTGGSQRGGDAAVARSWSGAVSSGRRPEVRPLAPALTPSAAATIHRQNVPPGSTSDPARLRATLRASGIELDDQDVADLARQYPDGIVLAGQPVQVLAILPDGFVGRQVVAFQVRPATPLPSAVTTYLLSVGHGRAIVVSSNGGPSVMLDAGSLTARPAVARGLSELLQAGLAAPPQRILVSSTDADHANEITRVLTVAGMQRAQIEVARQIIQSAIGQGRWQRLGLTRVANQVVEIDVIGGGVHQQRRVIGNMVITELRLESAHAAAATAGTASRYRAQANAVSPVTIVQDMVTGQTQVFQADATPRALSQIVDSIGEDAYRALLGGGGRNLRQAEDPHHGGSVGGGDASGFVRNLRIQFEASNGELRLFTQTGQRFSSGASAHVRVLDQVGVDVTRVTEPTPGRPGADVTRLQGGTTTQMSVDQGQLQQVVQGGQRVETEIMAGYRRLHELRELEEQLSPVRDAVTAAGLNEQVRSMAQITQQLQQQREALQGRLEGFWTELETAASGPQGMRAGIDVSRVQTEGQAIQQLVGQTRIEPLRESVEAHRGMLSATESLIANGFGMLDALQTGQYQRVEVLKAEQEALFRTAASVIGAREVMEHVRTAWNESGVSPRTFRNLAARIGEAAAEREIETRVSVAAGRRIEAQLRTQQILDGTLPGSTFTPASPGTRAGAGLLAAIEILRIALDVAVQVREARAASAAEASRQVQRGRNMVQWWVDRGVRPEVTLLDEDDHPITLTQDQIWQAMFGTPPAGVPQNARAVVTRVTGEDARRAVAMLTVSCTTLNDWYRLVNDGARDRERHGWTPFLRQDDRWGTLVFNVATNEYESMFDQEVHNSLERLRTRLTANQQADMNIQNAGAPVSTVQNSAWILGEDRVVWVWGSPGILTSIDFGAVRPRFVRAVDPVASNRIDGKIVVRAADTATYIRLRSAFWITDRTWIGANGTGNYFEANEQGKALVDPGSLEPAPATPPP
jgi:hypothetical protein